MVKVNTFRILLNFSSPTPSHESNAKPITFNVTGEIEHLAEAQLHNNNKLNNLRLPIAVKHSDLTINLCGL